MQEVEREEGREYVVLFFILSALKEKGETGKEKKKEEEEEGSSRNLFNHPCKLSAVV